MRNPVHQMWLAAGLLIVGAVLPFLMVSQIIPNSIVLSVIAYFSSIIGLFLGLFALATYYRARKRDDDGFGL